MRLVALAAIAIAAVITADAQSALQLVVPRFEADPLFFQNLPNRWTTGMVGGIAVDHATTSGSCIVLRASPTASAPPP